MSYPIDLSNARATKMWATEEDVEPQALEQLRRIDALPWVYGVRVMPDVHLGKGATVGSVIAMEQAVSPSAVGVDLGCGVSAIRTSLRLEDMEKLPELRSAIEATIPVGFNAHSAAVSVDKIFPGEWAKINAWNNLIMGFNWLHADVSHLEERAAKQLGTLGGGNHFIELCKDAEDRIWITLHSGSRNIGKELAERHITKAKTLPQNQDLPDPDLAVFLRDTPEMTAYRNDLMWAQDYAMLSRTIMLELVKHVVVDHFDQMKIRVFFDNEINCHHNYVNEEIIDGKMMLVTRKGAISARKGELALIPGSMGTGSYVVQGLGNETSFQSASHGAGRRMSRNAAKKKFSVEDLIAQTSDIESRKDKDIVDEIPAAYKNLDEVIAAQKDLVEVVQHLQTILCVKG